MDGWRRGAAVACINALNSWPVAGNSSPLDDLSIRVARLEAESAVRRLLHRYLHGIDVAATAELLELFTADAVVELRNFPPGSGKDRDLVGRDAINAVYSLLTAGTHRHHAANTSIVVADDSISADL